MSTSVERKTAATVHREVSESNLPTVGDESSPAQDDKSATSGQEMQIHTMPMKDTSQTQPRPNIRRQVIPPSSSSFVGKFSYEPRSDEIAYYHGLFNYVASFLSDTSKSKTEIILPPKLVAEKLFLASKMPPEKLRVVWNMATAPAEDGEENTGCVTEERFASSASVESKSKGNSQLKSDVSAASGAESHTSKTSKTSRGGGKGSLVVMTQSQFNTTVRLIQLLQNRTSAMDSKLKNIDKTKLPGDGKGKGAFMNGKLVHYDEEGLLPAYFAGISGVVVAIPGSMEYKLNGNDTLVLTKRGNTMPVRRRTFDDDKVVATKTGGIRRRTVTGETHNKGTNETKMKQMEDELVQLKSNVQSLQLEVMQLKALVSKGGGDKMTRVISSPAMPTGHAHIKNSVNHKPASSSGNLKKQALASINSTGSPKRQAMASGASIDALGTRAVANTDVESAMKRPAAFSDIGANTTSNINHESKKDDAPNTGVESFWGNKDETPSESKYPVKLAPSIQNRVKDLGRQAKGRVAVREVASFDPRNPPNVSSNIPAMHPSAARQLIRVQPRVHDAPQSRGPLPSQAVDVAPNPNLRQSGSTAGSNSSGSGIIGKLRSSVGSEGQTSSPGMKSSSAGEFNSSTSKFRSTTAAIRTNPGEDFNTSLGSLHSSASNSRQINPRGNHQYFPPSSNSSSNGKKKYDPSKLSDAYSEATAPISNGSKNLKSSIKMRSNYPITGNAHHTNTTSSRTEHDDASFSRGPINKQKVAPARPARRLTRDALTASIRHIVRNKDGTTEVYQEKEAPPSTNAMDVQPLEPAPLSTSAVLQTIENGINKPKKKGNILVRRVSSS
jgi:hypothetical protein